MRVGDAIAAERVAVAGEFGVNPRATLACCVPVLKHEEAGAFTENKAVPRGIERAACSFGSVVVGGERSQQAKGSDTGRVQHRVEASGEDVVGEAAAHGLERGTERLAAGRTGGMDGCGVAL